MRKQVTRQQVLDMLRDAVVDSLEPCEARERAQRFARVDTLRNKLASMKETVA